LAMAISMILVIIATGLFLRLMWFPEYRGSDEFTVRAGVAMLTVGYALSLRGVLGLLRLNTRTLQTTRTTVFAAIWILAGLIGFVAIGFELIESGSSFGVAIMIGLSIGVLALIILAGVIVLPIGAISKANRAAAESMALSISIQVTLACPRCGHEQLFRTGLVRCTACKGALTIDIEEPRCECGYLLYRLTGTKCPECGRAVRPEHIWHAPSPFPAPAMDQAPASHSPPVISPPPA